MGSRSGMADRLVPPGGDHAPSVFNLDLLIINVLMYSFLHALLSWGGLRTAIRALLNHPTRIKSYAEARTIRGVGEKTALKVMPRFLSEFLLPIHCRLP